ncbi:hypothetical protein [Plesiomonas shigelloides]|uniref:hypothetical protein n=1 Tax=Plesiomonas shigelloides TaxID=703 RepID=UPI001E64BE75|nr:hypothetical protein [Plesiomonas shigelloides]
MKNQLLTDAQLFTIEALNRVEWFEWPEGCDLAEMDGGIYVYFYENMDEISVFAKSAVNVKIRHPNPESSLVTKAQFDNFNKLKESARIDVANQKITKELAMLIISAADEVIIARDGEHDDVHHEDAVKMVELYDRLNDEVAPPEIVRELARMALASLSEVTND